MMKKSFIYSLLFGIPGFFIALIVAFVLVGITAGAFWNFVFGDNPWPTWTETLLPAVFVFAFLLVWIVLIVVGYLTGKRLEADATLSMNHILIACGLTIAFILVILFQQLRIGNLGPKSDSALCSDYCLLNEYSGSGLPPRNTGDQTCSCYDNFGNETLKIPLDQIDLNVPK